MNYPIDLTFKIIALANQIYIRDAGGTTIGYVKQKMFRLKEDINIFADENQQTLLYNIKADRVIDFSAKYNFYNGSGRHLGSIKRRGMRSILKAHYDIFDSNERLVMEAQEENALIKVLDSVINSLPIIGMFSGYFINPAYLISKSGQDVAAKIQKQPAFLEGKFQLNRISDMSETEEELVMLGTTMMVLIERMRG